MPDLSERHRILSDELSFYRLKTKRLYDEAHAAESKTAELQTEMTYLEKENEAYKNKQDTIQYASEPKRPTPREELFDLIRDARLNPIYAKHLNIEMVGQTREQFKRNREGSILSVGYFPIFVNDLNFSEEDLLEEFKECLKNIDDYVNSLHHSTENPDLKTALDALLRL
jgi:hypothetical protein